MVLTYGTQKGIDAQVTNGLTIGYFGINDDLSKLPTLIGDWSIRTVPDEYKLGTGFIVAIPTNRRTRKLYRQGRITWLLGRGFTISQAVAYIRHANKYSRKWDHRVATFVCNHYDLDSTIIIAVLKNDNPKRAILEHGLYTYLGRSQLLTAFNILKAIRQL